VAQNIHRLSKVWVHCKVLPIFHKGDKKIEVKDQRRLPLNMVKHCQQNLCLQDKDVTKNIQQLALSFIFILIGIQSISKCIYMFYMKYVEMQAHKRCLRRTIKTKFVLLVFLLYIFFTHLLLLDYYRKNRMQLSLNTRHTVTKSPAM
jgi:hypothetical protein